MAQKVKQMVRWHCKNWWCCKAIIAASPGYGDGTMFHVMTYGKNNMGSYASQLSREQRWRIVQYIRTLATESSKQQRQQQRIQLQQQQQIQQVASQKGIIIKAFTQNKV